MRKGEEGLTRATGQKWKHDVCIVVVTFVPPPALHRHLENCLQIIGHSLATPKRPTLLRIVPLSQQLRYTLLQLLDFSLCCIFSLA